MTILTAIDRWSYAGAGTTGPFATTRKILDSSDVAVRILDTATGAVLSTLVLDVDYTVTDVGNPNGAAIRTTAAVAGGTTLLIVGQPALTQPSDFIGQADFKPKRHEDAYDRLANQVLWLQDQLNRAVLSPVEDSAVLGKLPRKALRVGLYQAFDVNGDPVASIGTGNDTALRTDLANGSAGTDGSILTGFRRSEAGSVAMSVHAVLAGWLTVGMFGAAGNGVANDSTAFANAFTAATSSGNLSVFVPGGTYLVDNLTVPDNVRLYGTGGGSILKKRANGAVLSLGKFSRVDSLYIDGNGGSFTGVGIDIPATVEFDGFQRVHEVTIRGTASYCVQYNGEFSGYCSVLSCCDFKTQNAGVTPAVKWGVETGASKHGNRYIVHCTAGSGPLVDASGSQNGCVLGGMTGGGTDPGFILNSASAKIIFQGVRLAGGGTQNIDGTSCVIQGCISQQDFVLVGTATGCVVTGNYCNTITLNSGATLNVVEANACSQVTDNSGSTGANANLVDIERTAYTPAWSVVAGTSTLGNGSITGSYSRKGKQVTISIRLIWGSTTSVSATGEWGFSVPFVPTAAVTYSGAGLVVDSGVTFYLATAQTRTTGVAEIIAYLNNNAQTVRSLQPMAWNTGDELRATVTYEI